MECDGVTLLTYIVKTTNFDKFQCSLVLLMMIFLFTNYIYILLASNYIQNCTKSNKKLKSCFEFSEGVPATVHGQYGNLEYEDLSHSFQFCVIDDSKN